MIKYLGSKRTLINHIRQIVGGFGDVGTVLDLFSGTSRVGHALKQDGYRVIANDHNQYAYTLGRCYVQADRDKVLAQVQQALAVMSKLPPCAGYFTETFCEKSKFFHPDNGARVDAMREWIASADLPVDVEAVVLVSLMEAADRVDSTTGVQMAYLKQWAARAHNEISLRVPAVLPGSGQALNLEAEQAASVAADLVYLDPPYNQHSYRGNYHIWESLVRWDKPQVYGKACKRIDCRSYQSDFNSKKRIHTAMEKVVSRLRCKHIVVSFNNEGFIDRQDMFELLSGHGHVGVVAVDFKRYVGAQIGIHNLQGQKVGKVSHL